MRVGIGAVESRPSPRAIDREGLSLRRLVTKVAVKFFSRIVTSFVDEALAAISDAERGFALAIVQRFSMRDTRSHSRG